MKIDNIAKYFLSVIKEQQDSKEGCWKSASDGDHIVNKTVYTCQALVTLRDCFQENSTVNALAKKGVRFLENTEVGGKLYDVFLKYHAFFKWPELIPADEYIEKLYDCLVKDYGEYGGRSNAESFELCFFLETALSADMYEGLPVDVRDRYEKLLNHYLNQPDETIKDFSHYLWATNIHFTITGDFPQKRRAKILNLLKTKEVQNGYWVIDGITDRRSETPILISNEFFTGHLIINFSKMLKNIEFDSNLYERISVMVSTVLRDFDLNHQWISGSYKVGKRKGDIYQTCLFFRALNEFSKINENSYSFVHDKLERKLTNYNFDIQKKSQSAKTDDPVSGPVKKLVIDKSYFIKNYEIDIHAGIEGQKGELLINKTETIGLSQREKDICVALYNELRATWDNMSPKDIGWVSHEALIKSVAVWRKKVEQLDDDCAQDVAVSDDTIRKAINGLNKKIRGLLRFSPDQDLIENGTPFLWARHYRFRVHPSCIDIID